jgi:hypothetical protein
MTVAGPTTASAHTRLDDRLASIFMAEIVHRQLNLLVDAAAFVNPLRSMRAGMSKDLQIADNQSQLVKAPEPHQRHLSSACNKIGFDLVAATSSREKCCRNSTTAVVDSPPLTPI